MQPMIRSFVIGLLCLGVSWPAAAAEAEPPGVEFTWALAAFRGVGLDGSWIAIVDDDSAREGNRLAPGDNLKMMVELLRPGFVYVLRQDGQDRLSLLFPSKLPHPAAAAEPGTRHFIPAEGAWLDRKGVAGEETIYVVASDRRLDDLDQLVPRYLAAETDAAREELLEKTLDRIAELQAQHAKLGRPIRKPASIGGAIRGVTRAHEIVKHAEDITAGGFFSATYTIQPQR